MKPALRAQMRLSEFKALDPWEENNNKVVREYHFGTKQYRTGNRQLTALLWIRTKNRSWNAKSGREWEKVNKNNARNVNKNQSVVRVRSKRSSEAK